MPPDTPARVHTTLDEAAIEAVSRLLGPLARLCLANGITFATAEEMLKQAFVQEAKDLQTETPANRSVSRISAATGIRRREVSRLLEASSVGRSAHPPLTSQVFARWTTDPAYRDQSGIPLVLRKQGPPPSFESLAQSVTKDIHPRSLLEELLRLGLASHDEDSDSLSLTDNAFVPKKDSRRMLELLSDNVGDHLDAAVTNVLKDGHQHLEQAVFADELSSESIEALRPLLTAQWQALRDALVPALEQLIQADSVAGRSQNQRVRIGLYTFSETTPDISDPSVDDTRPGRHSRKGAKK